MPHRFVCLLFFLNCWHDHLSCFVSVRKAMGKTNVIFALLITYFCAASVFAVVRRSSDGRFGVKKAEHEKSHINTNSLSNVQSVSYEDCSLSPELTSEIANYKPIVEGIINATLNGVYKGRTWRTLARFVDKFGSRIAGSDNLENAIDYMLELLKKSKLDNVHTEPALVPKWVRGRESCWMISPRLEKINILGLGSSIGTPSKGISAKIVVVSSFDELQQVGKEVKFCNSICIHKYSTYLSKIML